MELVPNLIFKSSWDEGATNIFLGTDKLNRLTRRSCETLLQKGYRALNKNVMK
jgi:hypothetical protein